MTGAHSLLGNQAKAKGLTKCRWRYMCKSPTLLPQLHRATLRVPSGGLLTRLSISQLLSSHDKSMYQGIVTTSVSLLILSKSECVCVCVCVCCCCFVLVWWRCVHVCIYYHVTDLELRSYVVMSYQSSWHACV